MILFLVYYKEYLFKIHFNIKNTNLNYNIAYLICLLYLSIGFLIYLHFKKRSHGGELILN